MAKILLDTDILISILRGMEPVTQRLDELFRQENSLSYSAVSVAELWQGMRQQDVQGTRHLLHQMECIPVSDAIGQLAGQYLQRFSRSHGLILSDALIAASAATHHANLWTFNRRHYPMSESTLI